MNTVFGVKIDGKSDGYHFSECIQVHPSKIGTEKTYTEKHDGTVFWWLIFVGSLSDSGTAGLV